MRASGLSCFGQSQKHGNEPRQGASERTSKWPNIYRVLLLYVASGDIVDSHNSTTFGKIVTTSHTLTHQSFIVESFLFAKCLSCRISFCFSLWYSLSVSLRSSQNVTYCAYMSSSVFSFIFQKWEICTRNEWRNSGMRKSHCLIDMRIISISPSLIRAFTMQNRGNALRAECTAIKCSLNENCIRNLRCDTYGMIFFRSSSFHYP